MVAALKVAYVVLMPLTAAFFLAVLFFSLAGIPPTAGFQPYQARTLAFGLGLGKDQVARAVDLSAEKYCSASIMLGKFHPV